jgi:hypothetical protein
MNTKEMAPVMRALKLGIGMLLFVFFAAACSQAEPPKAEETPSPASSQLPGGPDSHLFDGEKTKAGDRVANMTIVEADIAVSEAIPEYGPIGTVKFSGETEVSGTFEYVKDHEYLGEALTFTADEDSAARLPRLRNDQRKVWFVLENLEEAKSMLGSVAEKGTAVIVIDDYVIRYEPTEVWNTARLVRVLE